MEEVATFALDIDSSIAFKKCTIYALHHLFYTFTFKVVAFDALVLFRTPVKPNY